MTHLHWDPEEFRRNAHKAIDVLVDYFTHLEQFPVLSQVEPGEVRSHLP